MKYAPVDVELFIKSSEYVDTAVVPLLPVSFSDDIKEAAAMTEFVSTLTGHLERQLQGRILLIPGFSYIKNSRIESLEHLRKWETELLDKQFKYVFYVTSDFEWKQQEGQLKGTLLWLPSLPLQHMDESSKLSVMEDQVRQLMNLFIQNWREGEMV